MEYEPQYFSSLKMAKRELKKRFKNLRKSPFIAGTDEIITYGLSKGLLPAVYQSIISNSSLVSLRAPTRFKFYEIRFVEDGMILPIQLILTRLMIEP